MTPEVLMEFRIQCAELGVEYQEGKDGLPTHFCFRELFVRQALRALRKLARTVADSDDPTLFADFTMLQELFGNYVRKAWDFEDDTLMTDLQLRFARAVRARKGCPYTQAQYDKAHADATEDAKRNGRSKPAQWIIAGLLNVDVKTLKRWGRPEN